MEQLLQDLFLEFRSYYDLIVSLLPKLAIALLILLFFYLFANRIRKFTKRSLTKRMDDPLLATFIARMIKVLIVIIGCLLFLKVIGLDAVAGSLLASAGVGAFILGFAFKDIGENFLAGILLAFNRPFKIGDVVALEGIEGKIVALSLRDIHLRTAEGQDVFIPNSSVIKKPLINFTVDGDLRADFTLGFDYGSNMEKAIQLILETLSEVPGVMTVSRQPSVLINELGTSTINVTCYYWVDAFDPAYNFIEVKNQAVVSVLQRLDEAGYYMPSDILEIKNYKEADLKALTRQE